MVSVSLCRSSIWLPSSPWIDPPVPSPSGELLPPLHRFWSLDPPAEFLFAHHSVLCCHCHANSRLNMSPLLTGLLRFRLPIISVCCLASLLVAWAQWIVSFSYGLSLLICIELHAILFQSSLHRSICILVISYHQSCWPSPLCTTVDPDVSPNDLKHKVKFWIFQLCIHCLIINVTHLSWCVFYRFHHSLFSLVDGNSSR